MEHIKIPCNRCLKRVPMDFKWEGIWPGFVPDIERLKAIPELVANAPFLAEIDSAAGETGICERCNTYSEGRCSEEAAYCVLYNEQKRALWHQDPPEGEGYQLWETTTEGSPLSPVFSSLEELCDWATENATLYGAEKASIDVWREILTKKERKTNG